jgi:hypothetical protein
MFMCQSAGIMLSQLFDYKTTVIGLRHGAHETNPLVQLILDSFGEQGFLYAKVSFAVVASILLYRSPVAAWLLALLSFLVAFSNIEVLRLLLAAS